MSTTGQHHIDADAVRQHAAEATRRAAGTDLADLVGAVASDEVELMNEIMRLREREETLTRQLASSQRRAEGLFRIQTEAVRQARESRSRVATTRSDLDRLTVYAQATVAASRSGWADPVYLLAEYLCEIGRCPVQGADPHRLLAHGHL